MKVRYIGASDAQAQWGGCDDPRDVLIEGGVYEVDKKEIYAWNTKILLVGVEGRFNSVCFEELSELDLVAHRVATAGIDAIKDFERLEG